jgi:hypothetical protein
LGVVLALLLAAGCGKTSPAATGGLTKAIWVSGLQNTPVPTATHGRVLALAVARSLLGALRVPSDAILPGSPPRSSPIRSAPPTSSSPNLVDLHRIWRVRGSVREVLAAVRRSHPVGMTVNGGGSAGEHAPREPEHEYWWYVTFRAPARTGLGSDQLAISMTAAPGGSTLLRVDGQVIWLSMRSAAERVPTAVSSIEVRRGSAGGARRLLGVISEPAAVQRIVAALERLPIVQPGTWVCPSESANPTVVHLTFRDSARKVLAEALQAAGAEVGNCDPMYFSVQGREQKPLAEGASAIAIVSQILGVRLLAG